MSASAAKTSRRMPWRLAVLVPAATYVVIWRGVPGVTPMLTFSWLTALLTGGGMVAAGLWGPQMLAAAARAKKEANAMRRLKAEKAARKAASEKADAKLRRAL
ncbi:hypothetical protein SAMN04490357_7678 [Streptomyces misionensis]|uniref:Uncharacterized protein n=1 Tax=Streptomyces misionensis TaxID=67331 RepID=A0A1H5K2W2_9ACTN|nr:hypothetical protein [Streptomyces misionensis]SEE59055.1 hypothetical protein SAMN04490357_7678 [Streptomyces misionensis]